jgi:hypothetical protein
MGDSRLNSQFEPAHSLAILIQQTDGKVHLLRFTANQQARIKDILFDEYGEELESFGELTKELLEFYFDSKFTDQSEGTEQVLLKGNDAGVG